MSRKVKGFKYVSGRCAENLASSCRNLSTIGSTSSDSSLLSSRSGVDLDSNLHQQPLGWQRRDSDVRLQIQETGSAERMMMMKARIPDAVRRGGGGGGGGMPALVWSRDACSVSQLAKDYALRFPVIVKVTQGYYGDGRLKLSVGQVLQLYGSCEEHRIRATDAAGRQLSLPCSQLSSMEVECDAGSAAALCRQSHKPAAAINSGSMRLSDVLERCSLPLTVAVKSCSSSSSSRPDGSRTADLSVPIFPRVTLLTIESFYSCTHLLGNVIENGWLDSSSIVTIPEDLRPNFRIAIGLKDASVEEWKDFSGMFDRAARHIKFSAVKGYNGVIYHDWSEFSLTSPEDPEDAESSKSGAGPLMEIGHYLINKKPQNPKTGSQEEFDQRHQITTNFCRLSSTPGGASSLTSGFSDSASDIDSLGLASSRSSSRNVYDGATGSSGLSTQGVDRTGWGHDPTYVNLDDVSPSRPDKASRGKGVRPEVSEFGRRSTRQDNKRQSRAAGGTGAGGAVRLDDIALEELVIGSPEPGMTKTQADDNKGTLISIDEGYNTRESSSSCGNTKSLTTSSGRKRYSPVFF